MDWQPIETAPKDGTWFLGWRNGYYEQDRVQVFRWHEATLPQDSGWMNAPDNHEHGFDYEPTHWMPLPEPPTSSV